MNWIEVKIKTKAGNEDIISSILYDNGANGLAIEDPNDIAALAMRAEEWDFIDADLIKVDFDGIILKAYFSQEEDVKQITNKIRELVEGQGLGEMDLSEIDESNWAENWKTHYKTVRIGKKIVIKPSWEEFTPNEGDIVIELDPGMAFGTGSHETTTMCIEALEKYIHPGMTVYDVGSGSGILSVAAAKLNAKEVIGIDLDPMCIRISSENFQNNSVDDVAHALLGNLLDVVDGKADIVVANIIAEVVSGLIPDLKNYLNDDGIVITSGIIYEKLELVENAFLENGYKLIETVQLNGWCAVIAGRWSDA